MNRQSRTLLVLAVLAAAVAVVPAALARPTGTTVTVTAGKPSSFAFKLSVKSVPHGSITFNVTNGDTSGLPHDFKLCSTTTKLTGFSLPNTCAGKATTTLGMGASAKLTVTVAKAGTYEYLCTVSGHAAGGMKGVLKVT